MGKNPAWSWYIVWYFFLGGMAAGAYFMAALADLFGKERDRSVSRIGYGVAFPLVIILPLLLTLDLGMPIRTFYMFRLFKIDSPMSIGSWALLGFGLFALTSLILVLAEGRVEPARIVPVRRIRQVVAVPGMLLGFFIASYTGVLLGARGTAVGGMAVCATGRQPDAAKLPKRRPTVTRIDDWLKVARWCSVRSGPTSSRTDLGRRLQSRKERSWVAGRR